MKPVKCDYRYCKELAVWQVIFRYTSHYFGRDTGVARVCDKHVDLYEGSKSRLVPVVGGSG